MADWSALAGFAGLAGALENIQDRRVREAELQRRLTEGQGTWAPMTDRPGGWDILDQFLGYSRPGQASFGGQRYAYTPFPPMTEQDVIDLELTRPQTTTFPGQPSFNLAPAPPGSQPAGFGAPAAALAREPGMTFAPADLTAAPFAQQPGRQVTREVPLPGFVGRRLDPKLRDLILQEKLKERFERFKLAEQQKLFDRVDTPGGTPTDTGGATFDLPGTGAPTSTQAPTGPAPPSQVPAQAPPGQPSPTAPKPSGTPTKEMADAIADAHRLYPQVRPELITAIMAKESNFDVRATSPKGAQGLMQLMPATQKLLGVTDPFDITQNVRGGTRYFAQLLARYGGNEELALAAYNAGPEAVDKAGKKIPNFPETRAFVPGVLKLATPGAFATAAPSAQTQESSPAAGQDLPPGSVKVAGPGAGTPPAPTGPQGAGTQPTSGTVPLSPGEPFALTPEGRQRIDSNNRRTLANNQRLQALDVERRRVQAGIRAGMPGATDRLNALEASVRALRQENVGFYDDSQKTLGEEQKEWRAKLQRLEERRRRPEELQREKTAEKVAEEEFRLGQTLQDVQKDDASLFRDPRTAEPVDPTLPYRQVLASQKRKVDGMPEVIRVTKDQQERLEAVESALPRVQRIQQYIDQIYGPNGALGRMTPADRAVFTGVFGGTPLSERLREQFAQKYPELAAAQKYVNANSEALARAIAGVKGAAAEGDVQRARDMVANLTAGVTLWPPARFGVSLPDTRAVALRTMNDLVMTLEGNTGQLLRNPNFRYPTLRRYEIAEEPRVPLERAPAPAITPPTGLNPAWVQQRLPAMTPAQIREAPAEVIRDINRPSDIKGLDTEQRKALAARLRQRNEEAVKLRRAS